MATNYYLSPVAMIIQYFTAQGIILSNGKIWIYGAGTTTPVATFTDITGITPNGNPILLNSAGQLQNVSIWQAEGVFIKIQVTDANNNPIGNSIDQIEGINDPTGLGAFVTVADVNQIVNAAVAAGVQPIVNATIASTVTQSFVGGLLYPQTAAETYAIANFTIVGTLVQAPWYPAGNALRYGVDPTGTVDSTATMQNWVNATWAMFNYQDGQGLWSGGGGAMPVLTLPPGKYMISNTIYLPSSCTFKGTAHPANTVSHTRIILNSTGVQPARIWSANTAIPLFANINPGTGLGTPYFQSQNAGVTGNTQPNWASAPAAGNTVTDGTVVWLNQAPMTAGDNRNIPMFKFRRGTTPTGGNLQNSAVGSTIQELEFWMVTLGISTFSSPLSGIGLALGDYPNGGIFSFDVDADDFRFKDCVFQHSPAAIRASGINQTATVRADGFSGNRGLGIFFENCEFDAAASHFYIQNCYLDWYIEDCEFFGCIHRFEGCTGQIRYQSGNMSGNAWIDSGTKPNAWSLFMMNGVSVQPNINTQIAWVDFTATTGGAAVVDISENAAYSAATIGGYYVLGANGGRISDNILNDQGFNAPPGTGYPDYIAAIKALGCSNLLIAGNSITSTDSATYSGFGILTGPNGSTATANNFITSNSVTAPYNGAGLNGQDRKINVGTGDIRGINFGNTAGFTSPSGSNLALTGNLSLGQTQSPQALTGNGQTITTGISSTWPVVLSGALTGIILQAGVTPGMQIQVINQTNASITFAASGSNVADGSSCVIAALTQKTFVWNAITSLWYHS